MRVKVCKKENNWWKFAQKAVRLHPPAFSVLLSIHTSNKYNDNIHLGICLSSSQQKTGGLFSCWGYSKGALYWKTPGTIEDTTYILISEGVSENLLTEDWELPTSAFFPTLCKVQASRPVLPSWRVERSFFGTLTSPESKDAIMKSFHGNSPSHNILYWQQSCPPHPHLWPMGSGLPKRFSEYTTLKYEQPIKNKYLTKRVYSLHHTKTKQTGGKRKQVGGNRAYAGRGNFEKTITDILRELADNTEAWNQKNRMFKKRRNREFKNKKSLRNQQRNGRVEW